MKLFLHIGIVLLFTSIIFLSGCELITKGPEEGFNRRSGNELIVTELFTIAPEKYYNYTWIEFHNPTDKRIRWFAPTFPARAYVVGSGGTTHWTEDDGGAWTQLTSGTSVNLTSVDFPYPDTGYAVGEGGTVLKLVRDTSGTLNVTPLNANTSNDFNDVVFSPLSPTGYAIGDQGTIRRTIDRGLSWRTQNPPGSVASKNLNSIFFIGFNSIYIAGDSGTILKTTNSGVNWSTRYPGDAYVNENFYSVHFVADTGWVTGTNGTILISRNGGTTWAGETTKVSVTLRGSFFAPRDPNFRQRTGWVVGDNGVILTTANHGEKWTLQNSGTTSRLNSVTFVDEDRGWIFGEGGLILSTVNGGRTWVPQPSGTTSNLTSASFLPLSIVVLNYYQLSMLAQKKHFFFDPATGTVNFDFITYIDTGLVQFVDFSGFLFGEEVTIPPGGFRIIVSDSAKFQDHIKLGPGQTSRSNFAIGFDTIAIGPPFIIQPRNPVLWSLLASGELRVEKKFIKLVASTGQYLGFRSETLEIIRYGNYKSTPDPYPQNEPVGFIPDGWSLARYADDMGENLNTMSTLRSFYLSKDPIPGWFSQRHR
ncbi:MAG TPA: YCF48-related protein [Bacteroidota bacterium]|nr:YCF48-related protein [Bacteroidota bacterium]